ncbi:single-pass membrane protein with aspartate-rich tail 1b isoform X1 [Mugil cephalus]|uniref:single-pass membrane protein with aspartate-rich tail 1b isoform X1 n=1 Tax=Mugil cephalus TaxID=48193 RepID=UPI001FB7CE70|nr:single-pass membrane protein with aspartate-rich tail 1b isoform X1 [Mugil cephalus]
MASALGRLVRLSPLTKSPWTRSSPPCRTAVSTSSGAILPKPKKGGAGFLCGTGDQTPFGLIRIALVVVPFLYVGTQISKNFAALLEEHDIFVPEDDDDDD